MLSCVLLIITWNLWSFRRHHLIWLNGKMQALNWYSHVIYQISAKILRFKFLLIRFCRYTARSVTFCNSEAFNSWSAHYTAASSLISKLFDLTKCTCVNTPDPISSTIPFCELPPPTCEKNILLKPCVINIKMQFTAFYPHAPLFSRWFYSSFSSFAKAQPCKWMDMNFKQVLSQVMSSLDMIEAKKEDSLNILIKEKFCMLFHGRPFYSIYL